MDTYLWKPTRPINRGGAYPSAFISGEEDLTTGHSSEDVKPANSIEIKGPPESSMIDLGGTGWTKPDAFRNVVFNHETQHSLPPAQGASMTSELFSAGAEAIGGNADTSAVDEVPYTWSLIAYPSGGPMGCSDVRNFGSNYQARSAFMSYLAYNFRGADTSATFAGLNDDLLRRWARSGRHFSDLRRLLADDSCGTCFTKTYFHPGGSPLDTTSRLGLMLHNWRVANYVNNSALDEGEYGYPPQFGFAPSKQLKAWQSFDGCGVVDDVIAIPPEVTLTSRQLTRDTTFAGSRSYEGTNYPLVLQPLGSEYWVVRSDPSLGSPGQDLIVRVSPEGLGVLEHKYFACGSPQSAQRFDGRLYASVVGYREQNEQGGVPAKLWQHPEWAVRSFSPRWIDVDSLADDLEFVIPSFGDSIKAAIVVLSLADGPQTTLQSQPVFVYTELLKYRLHLAVRADTMPPSNPEFVGFNQAILEDQASWSPTADTLVYTETPASGHSQIYMRRTAIHKVPVYGTNPPFKQKLPDWSPRGDWIAWSQFRSAWPYEDIYVYNRVTSEFRLLTPGLEGADLCAVFQPNGQRLAYIVHVVDQQQELGPWEIRRIDLSGAHDTVLVSRGSGANIRSPRWSRDGKWLYFTANDSLYAVGADGAIRGKVVSRAAVADSVTTFDFSPAGGRMVLEQPGIARFPQACNFLQDTVLVNHATFRRLALRDTLTKFDDPRFYVSGAQFTHPRWSPDGTRIAFTSDQMDAAGAERDLYVGWVSWNRPPRFSPEPRDTVLTACGSFSMDLDATDPDGEAVTFEAAYLPAGATFNTSNGLLTWDPPVSGDHYVVFRALDGSGGVHSKVVRLSVPDSVRPAKVETLAAEFVSFNSVGLTFISVADDSLEDGGAACKYVLKRHTQTITESNWNSATNVTVSDPPQSPGNEELIQVSGLQSNTTYYFAIKTRDEAGDHLAAISNVASAHTLSGGGGGMSARRTGPGEASVRGAEASIGSAPREVEAAGLRPSTQAMAAELSKAGDDVAWRLYRLGQDETSSLAGSGGEPRLLLQVPDGEGWKTRASFSLAVDCSVFALRAPRSERGRAVVVGGHDLVMAAAEARGGAKATHGVRASAADHSRLGSLLTNLAPPAGVIEIASGDTLGLGYEAMETEASPVDWYLLFRRSGAAVTMAAATGGGAELPRTFALEQNRPNPFSSLTTIRFALPRSEHVRLELFDLAGRRVATLADGGFPAGFHAVDWNRRADGGRVVQPGVYIYRMEAGAFHDRKKLTLLP